MCPKCKPTEFKGEILMCAKHKPTEFKGEILHNKMRCG